MAPSKLSQSKRASQFSLQVRVASDRWIDPSGKEQQCKNLKNENGATAPSFGLDPRLGGSAFLSAESGTEKIAARLTTRPQRSCCGEDWPSSKPKPSYQKQACASTSS